MQFAMGVELIKNLHEKYLPFEPQGEKIGFAVSAEVHKTEYYLPKGTHVIYSANASIKVDNGIAGYLEPLSGVLLDNMLRPNGAGKLHILINQHLHKDHRNPYLPRIVVETDSAKIGHPVLERYTNNGYVELQGEKIFTNCQSINEMKFRN